MTEPVLIHEIQEKILKLPIPEEIDNYIFELTFRSRFHFQRLELNSHGNIVWFEDFDDVYYQIQSFANENITLFTSFINKLINILRENGRNISDYVQADEYTEQIESKFSDESNLQFNESTLLWRYIWDKFYTLIFEIANNIYFHDCAIADVRVFTVLGH